MTMMCHQAGVRQSGARAAAAPVAVYIVRADDAMARNAERSYSCGVTDVMSMKKSRVDARADPVGAPMDLLDTYAVRPLPQIVFRIDSVGRVLDLEAALAGDSLVFEPPQRGWTVHRCLHPDCAEAGCRLLACLKLALERVNVARILEWEMPEELPNLTLRLHMRRASSAATTWATLTVTDITRGRQVVGKLREANLALGEMMDRIESSRVRQVRRLDHKLRSLSAELIIAQENERRRIAAELHDGLGQWLSMAKLCLDGGMQKVTEVEASGLLRKSFSHLQAAIQEVRSIVRNLRPSILQEIGFAPTVELLCHELQASQPQLTVSCQIEGDLKTLPQAQCVAIVRVLQEALHNVAKHSGATRVQVQVRLLADQIVLRVRDNGCGIRTDAVGKVSAAGLGLASMRDRAVQSGGRFRVAATAGAGTQITANWLLGAAEQPAGQDSGTYKTISDSISRD
jgi:signal transduction histidine kinase